MNIKRVRTTSTFLRLYLVAFIAFFFVTEHSFAQDKGFFNVSFSVLNPQGDFRKALDSLGTPEVGHGFGLQGGLMLEGLPLTIGIHLDYFFMGSRERFFTTSAIGGTVRDTVSTQTSFLPFTFFFRLQPNIQDRFFPYAEGFFGMNFINSTSTIRTNIQQPTGSQRGGESCIEAPLLHGVGAGFMLKMLDILSEEKSVGSAFLDLKIRYAIGAKTSYKIIQEIQNNGSVRYKQASSTTDIVTFSAGFSFRF